MNKSSLPVPNFPTSIRPLRKSRELLHYTHDHKRRTKSDTVQTRNSFLVSPLNMSLIGKYSQLINSWGWCHRSHTMKKRTVLLCVASSLLLAGCGTMSHATKWEYKIEDANQWQVKGADPQAWRAGYEARLNDLGKDGWVLIMERDGRIFYFKRVIK
jgi:hypothetical protein